MEEPKFSRIWFNYQDEPREKQKACTSLREAVALRKKYEYSSSKDATTQSQYQVIAEKGVYKLTTNTGGELKAPPSFHDFFKDYSRMLDIMNEGPVKTYSYWRLKMLEMKFDLHLKLNRKHEKEANRVGFKDWSTVVKVDNNVHLSSAMTRKHLLAFITSKAEKCHEEVVMHQANGTPETLGQILQRLNLSKERLTIDNLDVEAGKRIFQRFDEVGSNYTPFGFSELRTIFMETSNHVQGRYMAELTKELFQTSDEAGIATEYRITIYGSKRNEWALLAQWAYSNKVRSSRNRWLIQIPRIFSSFNERGLVKSYQEMLDNPLLAHFLRDISGFDSVGDEGKLERIDKSYPPTYLLDTFDFRPHCGETGDVDNLVAGFLLAKGINHGINLGKSTALQFYLCGIGITVSPLSNNNRALDYKRNPFFVFFNRGLNVSLSSSDPLLVHHTNNPLVEEYVVAAARSKLSECDLCEIARYSVLQSGFPYDVKVQWLGSKYQQSGVAGNDIRFSNVPNIRIAYRTETMEEELYLLHSTKVVSPAASNQLQKSLSLSDLSRYSYNRVVLDEIEEAKPRITASGEKIESEADIALQQLRELIDIRAKYKSNFIFERNGTLPTPVSLPKFASTSRQYSSKCIDGIVNLYNNPTSDLCSNDMTALATMECNECGALYCSDCDRVLHKHPEKKQHARRCLATALFPFPSFVDFLADLRKLVSFISSSGPLRTYCATRLEIIDRLFAFHTLMNQHLEHKARIDMAHKKGKVIQVDNHIHLTGLMTASHFVDFVKRKVRTESDQIVQQSGRETLGNVLLKLGISEANITLDSLGVTAYDSMFTRFDALKAKYQPFGSSDLHALFLHRTNELEGRYYAELIKEAFEKNEKLDVHTESGISMHGRTFSDWDDLAWWVSFFKIDSVNNRWVVQIPRQYHFHKKNNDINNFQDMLSNIFVPLLDASKNPDSHPFVAEFLQKVTAFDIVDDESQPERDILNSYL